MLVNDGSRDDSWAVLRRLAANDPAIRAVSLMRNYGQHNALLAGVRLARGEITVTLDDDLQHPPEEVLKLVAELNNGYDVVYGTPARLPHSMLRNAAAWTTKLALQKTIGAETARNVSAFRAFRTSLRRAFEEYRSPYVSLDVLLTWATSRFSSVKVEHRPREIGESNYRFSTLVRHALTMITGFSILPLRLASLTGFFFTVIGFRGAHLRHRRLLHPPRQRSRISVPRVDHRDLFRSAALSLGIMGEYLARIHVRVMERPPYAIAESITGGSAGHGAAAEPSPVTAAAAAERI